VPIYLAQASNLLVTQFDLAFNTGKVSPAGAALAPRAAGQRVKSKDVAPGVKRVLAYSLARSAPVGTNRTIATVPFTLALREYIGSGPLAPTNPLLVQRDETVLAPVTLNSGTIFARPVNVRLDGTVDFFLPTTPGSNYVVQASADLVQWTSIATNRATSDFLEWNDPEGRFFDYRFYRLRTE
jgi:hypothetical protein